MKIRQRAEKKGRVERQEKGREREMEAEKEKGRQNKEKTYGVKGKGRMNEIKKQNNERGMKSR